MYRFLSWANKLPNIRIKHCKQLLVDKIFIETYSFLYNIYFNFLIKNIYYF